MASLEELLGSLSSDAHARGRQFERICKWYLQNDPIYRRDLDRVWLWSEWPDRWAEEDLGIDLVAKAKDGSHWAVQAKCYDESYPIKKSDVDSFLSESARGAFSTRLLIVTTNRLGARARKVIENQPVTTLVRLRFQLEEATIDWPESPERLRKPRPARWSPLPHQSDAIGDVLAGFKNGDRGQLIMACGTGKTLVGLWTAERIRAERTLVLVPSLSLLSQTVREWTSHGKDFRFLPVCSDFKGEDELVAHTADLGYPTTTDPERITEFLAGVGRKVVFSTYHSSPKVAEAMADEVPPFNLVIADEAHRCAGRASKEFTTVLDPNLIRAHKRLFMTATPRIPTKTKRGKLGEDDVEVISMGDESKFGPRFHTLPFSEAIRRDLLTDYEVVIAIVDGATYRDYAKKGRHVRVQDRVTDARTLASQIALAKTMNEFDLRRVISFHSRVAWADRFAQSFLETLTWIPAEERPSGDIWATHISGAMSTLRRDQLLTRLRGVRDGERGLLSNARCLSEGVDVPALDGVTFIDPRRSQVEVVQATGRAIRKADNKHRGVIVLPVFVAGTDDPHSALSGSAFDHVWQVLKALKSHDDVLANQLDALKRGLGERRRLDASPPKITILPATLDVRFVEAVRTRAVEVTTESWPFWIGALKAYIATNGDPHVPQEYVSESGVRLGQWVGSVRDRRRAGSLSPDRVRELDELGLLWDPKKERWAEALDVCRAYCRETGKTLADVEIGDEFRGFPIGRWLHKRRQARRSGHASLSSGRIADLDSLGMDWNPHDSQWDDAFAICRRWCRQTSKTLGSVTWPTVFEGFRIGQWIGVQRKSYAAGHLSTDRVAALEGLGIVWDKFDAWWAAGWAACQEWHVATGRPLRDVKAREVFNDFALGNWLESRRQSREV